MKKSVLACWGFYLVLLAYILMVISFFTQGSYFSGVSFIFAGFLGVATLVIGLVARVKIKRDKLKGKNYAIATIILSFILVVYFLYVLYALYWLAVNPI